MPPSYLPLRWESTGDQWWYASPIDWAAANGHFDLVRQLIKLDGNNFINLTSLRRIRRLETVWDDEEQFHYVATCRSLVARELFSECETKTGKNSLIGSGYGGWLLYTAASAGDLAFVRDLLKTDPLLVFGEGEYGVTDMLYAGARSKNREVFKAIYDFASSPRFSIAENGKEIDIPRAYTWEMMNRAVHAAARGGNLMVLKEIIGNCSCDVLGFRDKQGSTILHAAASKGQVAQGLFTKREMIVAPGIDPDQMRFTLSGVVKDLISCLDIINSTDNNGNTALHVAAHRGHLSVVEALITESPSSIHQANNSSETFLHMVMSGFQKPTFHRLDRQIELMKQLVRGKLPEIESIINVTNNDGRTALHVAIIGNVPSELVELLMTIRSININIRDVNYMTPLDLLKQRPRSATSDILTRQLISAGGIFGSQDYISRKTIASHLRMRSIGSPGTSFTISDTEIFLHTENTLDHKSINVEPYVHESTIETHQSSNLKVWKNKKPHGVSYATERIKRLLHWPKTGEKKKKKMKVVKTDEIDTREIPVPLRQRFSKPTSLPNNKRTSSVRSNLPSPIAQKKLAFGLVDGVMQAMPRHRRSLSSSFSKTSSVSSPVSLDKQKGVYIEADIAGPSSGYEASNLGRKNGSVNRSLMKEYLCFGATNLFVKDPIRQDELHKDYKDFALSVA